MKGVTPPLTPRCNRYWKERLLAALDYDRQQQQAIVAVEKPVPSLEIDPWKETWPSDPARDKKGRSSSLLYWQNICSCSFGVRDNILTLSATSHLPKKYWKTEISKREGLTARTAERKTQLSGLSLPKVPRLTLTIWNPHKYMPHQKKMTTPPSLEREKSIHFLDFKKRLEETRQSAPSRGLSHSSPDNYASTDATRPKYASLKNGQSNAFSYISV